MTFAEAEGTTLILDRRQAEAAGLPDDPPMAWITLTVHSSLEAVGLTATVSNALAQANIGCNMVAAYYHDHIFVPDAGAAFALLTALSDQRRTGPRLGKSGR